MEEKHTYELAKWHAIFSFLGFTIIAGLAIFVVALQNFFWDLAGVVFFALFLAIVFLILVGKYAFHY